MNRTPSPTSLLLVTGVLVAGVLLLAFRGGSGERQGADPQALRPGEAAALEPEALPGQLPRSANLLAQEAAPERQAVAALDEGGLNLAAGEGLLLEGWVFAAADRTPLLGASLVVRGDGWKVKGQSGELGAFQMRVPTVDLAALSVTCDGFATLRRPAVSSGKPLQLELQTAATLLGEVLGGAQAQPNGRALLWDMHGGRGRKRPMQEVTIDDKGAFTFSDLHTSEYQVCVIFPGFGLEFMKAIALTSGDTKRIQLRPERAGILRGQVVFLDSTRPVVGASVRVTPVVPGLGSEVLAHAEFETTTDAQGRYEVQGLQIGESAILVSTSWGSRAGGRCTVHFPSQQLEENFELGASASLSGSVVNDQRQAVGGATVQVRWEGKPFTTMEAGKRSKDSGFRVTQTDTNGRFEVENVPAGRSLSVLAYQGSKNMLTAQGADTLSPILSVRLGTEEQRENLEIRLHATRSVQGRLLDPDGQAVAGAAVGVLYRSGGSGRMGKPERGLRSLQKSNTAGHFEFSGLLPGRYTLAIRAEGFLYDESSFVVVPEPEVQTPLEVKLKPSHSLRGIVVDQVGNSIPNARINARLDAPLPLRGKSSKRQKSNPKGKRFKATADDYGRFLFESLPPGVYALEAVAVGFEPYGERQTRVESRFAFDVELLMRARKTPERCTVYGRFVASDGADLNRVDMKGARSAVLTRIGDRFEVQGLVPGPTRLSFSVPGYFPPKMKGLQLLEGSSTDLGTLEFNRAGELYVFVQKGSGKAITDFRGVLTQGDTTKKKGKNKSKKKSKSKGIRLNLVRAKHRFKGAAKTITTRAGHSAWVPLGTWTLTITRKGFAPFSKKLTFDEQTSLRSIEVELQRL